MTPFGTFAADRLQVLLLGPGFGESVLVRIPGTPDGWMIVDSLLSDRAGDEQCAPLAAMDVMGVEPDLVLLTHAHADHAAGMDSIVERFGDRASFGTLLFELGPTVSARIRSAAQGTEASAALRAIGQLPTERRWDLDAGPRQLGEGTVSVLHPSPTRLGELLKLASLGPNRISSAVMVEWRGRSVLLGADLERPEWASLRDVRRLRECDPVKVPHHGSAGAFDNTWAGDAGAEPDNTSRRMLVAPFDKHPKLPDIDSDDGLPRLLREVDAVHLSCLPYLTEPAASGTLSIRSLRLARDAARASQPRLPAIFGTASTPQLAHPESDAWLVAELSANGVCLVRGGHAHVSVIR